MHEPLALEYLAAGLLEQHDVKILDTRVEDKFEETLESFNPHIVATTGYTIHINFCKDILRKTKAFNKIKAFILNTN